MSQKQNKSKKKLEKPKEIPYDHYQKPSRITGFSGQLYETKLLNLVLLRALYDDNIKEFALGTNIDGLGAFDDIVLRYETNDTQKSKMIFLQAKHRDDPNNNKLTVGDIKKQSDDFSLQKYLDSYLNITHKFMTEKNNRMFEGTIEDIKCELVIFTSAKENFDKEKMLVDVEGESLIKTLQCGKVFQFVYDDQDVEDLIPTVVRTRTVQLARSLAELIVNDNFDDMTSDYLLKTYHVFLAQNVISIESTITPTEVVDDSILKSTLTPHCLGRVKDTFWITEDDNLALMRKVIVKEIAEMKGIKSLDQSNEVKSITQSLVFKLPVNFGHYGFLSDNRDKLEYFYTVFHKLLTRYSLSGDSKYIYVKVEDEIIDSETILVTNDSKNDVLAEFIGNLLINDDETEMLKFNSDEQSLSSDNIVILQRLKNDFDLSQFRFNINVHSFSKLSLSDRVRDRLLVRDFLNKLKFYTDQAKEDEVETIVTNEIDKLFEVQQTQNDFSFRIKREAIFLKVHDKIQKWWKLTELAYYLNKSCAFFQQAYEEILLNPLLGIIHFTYNEKIKKYDLEFEIDTINDLGLDSFLNSDKKIMRMISNEIIFTSSKIIQYFGAKESQQQYIFIDLDLVLVEHCLETLKKELESSTVPLLILINRNCSDTSKLCQIVNDIANLFKGKIVILSNYSHKDNLEVTGYEIIVQKDNLNNFRNLSNNVRELILQERKVIFHGEEVSVGTIFDSISLDLLSSKLLYKIFSNDLLIIGKTLKGPLYRKTVDVYINRSVCRYITLNYDQYVERHKNNEKILIADDIIQTEIPQGINDILLNTESEHIFEEHLKKVNNETQHVNIHWFTSKSEHSDIIWKQSQGTVQSMVKSVKRGLHQDFIFQLENLKALQEKVVIIRAEAGMGKTTLLTHLAINTKREHPNLWIIHISLLNFIDQFDDWKKNRTKIDLKKAMMFLYTTINKDYYKLIDADNDNFAKLITVDTDNEIHFSDYDDKCSPEVDLSEIKLLNYFYNNNNIAVLCDGFDEICPDYKNIVIEFLSTLKTSKVAHLWVASRNYNIVDDLESALGTFSFGLMPLTVAEQMLFLQNVWSIKLDLDKRLNINDSNMYVEKFYSTVIAKALDNKQETFLNLPLHLFMISELFETYYNDYVECKVKRPSDEYDAPHFENISNLNALYDEYTNMKFFTIRFGEKKASINFTDPDMRRMVEKEQELFAYNHALTASYLICYEDQLNKNAIQYVLEYIETVKSGEEKTGIIECVIDEQPKFVHITLAEYYAAEAIFDNIIGNRKPIMPGRLSAMQYIMADKLLDLNIGVRRFFDSKLERYNIRSRYS